MTIAKRRLREANGGPQRQKAEDRIVKKWGGGERSQKITRMHSPVNSVSELTRPERG